MTKALALSGGGARGSFQLGAITAVYEVYGFRPDLIAGTSVGSVNAIMLAQAPPPRVNDAARILADAAAGTVDAGLARVRMLQTAWLGFRSPADFFTIQPAFAGTMLQDAVNGISRPPSGDPPMHVELANLIDLASGLLATPILNTFSGPFAAAKLQEVRPMAMGLFTENAVCNLDPITAQLNNPALLDLPTLAAGTPVWFAAISLESGRLRYVDGTGAFTESDLRTPVVTALMGTDVDAALDENLQPLDTTRKQRIQDLIDRHRAVIAELGLRRAVIAAPGTQKRDRLAAIHALPRLKERGDYLFGALRGQIQGLTITARVDPRRGVIASASIPAYFDPIVIGAERYVDGGLREILPTQAFAGRRVTELIGISCSTSELPPTDQLAAAGLATVVMRSLTEIALEEITAGDFATARQLVPSAVIIEPLIDVHTTIQVVPGLIELSQDYGWMRACDELQPGLVAAQRGDARQLSTLITRLRRDSWTDEWLASDNAQFSYAAEAKPVLQRMRMRAWAVRELLRRRALMGLPAEPSSGLWWRRWGRDFRPHSPFGTSSIWSTQSAWSGNSNELRVASEVTDPAGYAPSEGALVDLGNDRVHWVVRGAVFWARTETETSTARRPVVLVPNGTASWLPTIPRGRHLVADSDAPGTVWVLAEGGRYASTPALIAAAGLTGAEVALLPPGASADIPLRSDTSWLRRLAVTDSARTVLTRWGPTPQEVGSITTSSIGLTNATNGPITVTGIAFRTDQDTPDGAVVSLAGPLPVVPAGAFVWVPVRFAPRLSGTITGRVTVSCNDPLTGTFEIDLVTGARATGPLGQLEVAPAALDFGAVRVGSTSGTDLVLRNIGDATLQLPSIIARSTDPAGGIGVPMVLPTQLAAGATASVYVSCVPSARGAHQASVTIETLARTGAGRELRGTVEVPVTVSALAPRAFLADRAALPPLLGGPGRRPPVLRPPIVRPPVLITELQRLDFGAVDPGATATRTFWIRSTGDVPLHVAGVRSVASSTFGVPDLTIFPRDLAPGEELAVTVNALGSPVPGFPLAGELWVETDDPLRPRAVITAVGRTSGPRLQVPSELLDLGSGGSPLTTNLVATSVGTDPVTVVKVGVRDDPPFAISGVPPLPLTLSAGEALTVQVTCTGQPGRHRSQLVIEHRTGGAYVELVAELT